MYYRSKSTPRRTQLLRRKPGDLDLGPVAILVALLSTALACEDYDSPPVARLVQPEGGAYTQGEPVRILFSEAVDADSVRLRIWPNVRDIEGELEDGLEPIVEGCAADSTCGDASTSMQDGGKELVISLGGELGKPGSPLVIEIEPGLADEAGHATGAPFTWDIQFRPGAGANTEPVEFDDGVYLILAEVDDPLPATLTLIGEVKVLSDGRMAFAGGEGDEINGAPKNTREPENLVIDETDQGFTAHLSGQVTLTEDGKRLMETEPVDVSIPVGPLLVHLTGVRMFAEIKKNADTGKDEFDGTLSFEALELQNGDRVLPYEGASTALVGDYVPREVAPAGHPELCGDLCGAVVLGLCEPPPSFPDPEFCTE